MIDHTAEGTAYFWAAGCLATALAQLNTAVGALHHTTAATEVEDDDLTSTTTAAIAEIAEIAGRVAQAEFYARKMSQAHLRQATAARAVYASPSEGTTRT